MDEMQEKNSRKKSKFSCQNCHKSMLSKKVRYSALAVGFVSALAIMADPVIVALNSSRSSDLSSAVSGIGYTGLFLFILAQFFIKVPKECPHCGKFQKEEQKDEFADDKAMNPLLKGILVVLALGFMATMGMLFYLWLSYQ